MERIEKEAANIGVILLGAGASSRLGSPKQLLPYNGQMLLQHSLQVAADSNGNPVVVVLGAQAAIIEKEVDSNLANIVVNDSWQEGMASSIRCGVKTIMDAYPMISGVILMVCDQPYITPTLLNDLIATHLKTGSPIVTCSYSNTFGPPTLFHKGIFPELLEIKGDMGARRILQKHANVVAHILFPEGVADIDTKDDYQKILKDQN